MSALQANDLEFYQAHVNKVMAETNINNNLFGLLVCTYNNLKIENGYYNPSTMNIGDYIQSLAQLQFLPSTHEFVDRDQLATYKNEQIKMIMNAWYFIWKKNEIFSDKISPLMISIHINNLHKLSQKTLDYFKQHEPIGCRDLATRDFLLEKGIVAYFSGCLTLTLGLSYKVNENQRSNAVYFVDCTPETYSPLIQNKLSIILQEYNKLDFHYINHNYPLYNDPLVNLRKAELILQEYAKARLVVTSRLHCALPCLSLGTPVIFLPKVFDHKRYHGLINLLNYMYYDEKNELQEQMNFDIFAKVANKDNYLKIQNQLTAICKSFTGVQQLNFSGLKQTNNYLDLIQETNKHILNTTRSLKNTIHEVNILKKQLVTPPPPDYNPKKSLDKI